MLLGNDGLVSEAVERIRAGNWALGAWRATIAENAHVFEQMEDPYLRTRAEDIREIGQRILARLQSDLRESRQFPERCVLVGETIGITEIAAVPTGRLVGIVCMRGSALSHTAVLARALGIPAVVSLTALPTARLDGCEMIVDGYEARLYVQPSRKVLEAFQQRIGEEKALATRLAALRDKPAETLDGIRMPLYANIGLVSDTAAARDNGAEGDGLYRLSIRFCCAKHFQRRTSSIRSIGSCWSRSRKTR
jgi:phosphotransferase system enzyme I (PtsP)